MKKHKEKNCHQELTEIATSETETISNSETPSTSNTAIKSSSTSNLTNKIQHQMSNFVVKTTARDKEKLDVQLARFVFGTNSAFALVEHPEFIKFCEMLRPGYKPANKKQLGSKLLDTVFESEKQQTKQSLKNESVCFSFDGWSNLRQQPILSAAVTKDNGEVILVDTIDASGISQKSLNCEKRNCEKRNKKN